MELSQRKIPRVKSWIQSEPFFETPTRVIGVFESELKGSTKFVTNFNGGVVVYTPAFTKKEIRDLPHNIYGGKDKWLVKLEDCKIEEPEDTIEKEIDGNQLLKIMLTFSKEDILDAIEQYTHHERASS